MMEEDYDDDYHNLYDDVSPRCRFFRRNNWNEVYCKLGHTIELPGGLIYCDTCPDRT
jgi:hypothetical protein